MDLGVLTDDTWRTLLIAIDVVFLLTVVGWVAGMVAAQRSPLVLGDEPVSARALRLHSLTFVNASLIAPTLAATLVLALAAPAREGPGVLDVLGLVFLAVYVTINTGAYTSQYAVLPALIAAPPLDDGGTVPPDEVTDLALRRAAARRWHFEAPRSLPYAMAMLGYACFGLATFALAPGLTAMGGVWRWAGIALLVSGASSVLGYIGFVARRRGLEQASVVGGVIALLVGGLILAAALTA